MRATLRFHRFPFAVPVKLAGVDVFQQTSQHASSVESDTLDISSSAGSVNGSVYGTPRERFEQTEHGH